MLKKLPFAPDPTLVMKPLLSFWFSCCLEIFIILFLSSSTATPGFSGLAFKNSLSTILFTTFLGLPHNHRYQYYIQYTTCTYLPRTGTRQWIVQPSVPHNCQKYTLSMTNWKIPMNFYRWIHLWAIHFLSVSLTFCATTTLVTKKKIGSFPCNPVSMQFR